MRIAQRALWVIIVVELAVVGVVIARQRARPQPPLPDFTSVNELAAVDLRELRAELMDRIRADQDSVEDWLKLGDAYLAIGLFPEAEQCYHYTSQLEPTRFDVNFYWGISLERVGLSEQAIERYRQAIQVADAEQLAECWFRIGANFLRQENADEAEAAFRKALDYTRAIPQLMKLLIRSGRAEEARPLWDKLAGEHPLAFLTQQLRAQIEQELGNVETATQFRQRANRAPLILKSFSYGDILTPIRRRYTLSRRYQEIDALIASDELDQAAAIGTEVIRFDHLRRDKNMPLLARIELMRGQPETAAQLLESLMVRDGAAPDSLELLGDAYWSMQEWEKAQQRWLRAVRIRGTEALHQRLVKSHQREGDEKAAIQHQALAHQAAGIDAFWNNNLADADPALRKAVELDPKLAHAWFYLGEIARFLGLPLEARQNYDQCLALDPDHGRVP